MSVAFVFTFLWNYPEIVTQMKPVIGNMVVNAMPTPFFQKPSSDGKSQTECQQQEKSKRICVVMSFAHEVLTGHFYRQTPLPQPITPPLIFISVPA
ncbi:MAG: hypothetical protein K2L46_08795 [Paramuribaculum sp.]|nr:hypothetical protein [Paramuribaculum sp.]MDE6489364.1 hypothetical protein [Paramuribaculum sp.]